MVPGAFACSRGTGGRRCCQTMARAGVAGPSRVLLLRVLFAAVVAAIPLLWLLRSRYRPRRRFCVRFCHVLAGSHAKRPLSVTSCQVLAKYHAKGLLACVFASAVAECHAKGPASSVSVYFCQRLAETHAIWLRHAETCIRREAEYIYHLAQEVDQRPFSSVG